MTSYAAEQHSCHHCLHLDAYHYTTRGCLYTYPSGDLCSCRMKLHPPMWGSKHVAENPCGDCKHEVVAHGAEVGCTQLDAYGTSCLCSQTFLVNGGFSVDKKEEKEKENTEIELVPKIDWRTTSIPVLPASVTVPAPLPPPPPIVTVPDLMVSTCSLCGALVGDEAAKKLHQQWHRDYA